MKQTAKILILIMASFFSYILNIKAQNKNGMFPPEKFVVLEAKIKSGKPLVGSVNRAYKYYKYKSAYPWCLKINIALDLKSVKEDGLPTQVESDIANKFEDELLAKINKLTTAHYIGHMYNDTFLDVYIYLDNPEKAHQFLQTQINNKKLTRPIAYEIKKDSEWSIVEPFM